MGTFKNLAILKKHQAEAKRTLGKKYFSTVGLFVEIVRKVMEAQSRVTGEVVNEFEAAKYIKDNLAIYNKPGAPICFAAAVIELTEGKHFSGLKE